jgi:Uma2 family endonuclease
MPTIVSTPPYESGPAWDVARLFPEQGEWNEVDYLSLARNTNRLIELSDGRLEVLPMPSKVHQRLVLFLCNLINAFARPRGLGEALLAGYPVRLWLGKFREPDVVFVLAAHEPAMGESYASAADLVIEVVSENDPDRDRISKREEYAKATIAEYWIVDPQHRTIDLFRLVGKEYALVGRYVPGQRFDSPLLVGLCVDIREVFAAGDGLR